jgi:hypothetical protein
MVQRHDNLGPHFCATLAQWFTKIKVHGSISINCAFRHLKEKKKRQKFSADSASQPKSVKRKENSRQAMGNLA